MEMSLADRNLPSIQALFTTTTTGIQTFFNINNNILMLYLQQQHPSNLFKTTISFRRIFNNNNILLTYLQQQYHSDVFTTTTSFRLIYKTTS
jgi:hypothetical protein